MIKNDLSENLLEKPDKTTEDTSINKQQEQDEKFKNKRYLGYIYMFMFIVCACLQHLFTKMIYNRHSDAGALQVLLLRAIISTLISFALMNKHIVSIMYTSIPKSSYSNLFVRVIQGLFSFSFIYYALRYLPFYILTEFIVDIFDQLNLVIGVCFYDYEFISNNNSHYVLLYVRRALEQIRYLDSYYILCGWSQDASSEINKSSTNPDQDTSNIWAWIALMTIPFSAAYNGINQRQMRSLNEYTVGAYMTLSMIVFYFPIVYIFDDGLQFTNNFEQQDWIMTMLIGITGCYFNIFRFKALQYEEPGKLAGISYFQSIIQLFLDVMFLDQRFTIEQLYGIIVIIGANAIKLGLWIKKLASK